MVSKKNLSVDNSQTVHRKAAERALMRAIKIMGGIRELAEALGISPVAVLHWTKTTKHVPAARMAKVAELTKMRITEIRPDLFYTGGPDG
jgi:DNA-binding transcriptional regulator YdaS (Cro superfamily)